MAKSKFTRISIIASVALVLPAVLTGCAPAFDEKLVATCDGIRENLSQLRDWPTELADYEFASNLYMAINIGDARRAEFALRVNALYPWMATYADYSSPAFYYSGVEGGLWQKATEGTPVAYSVSAADQAEYLNDEGLNLEEILGQSIESIIGDGYETGCAEYDKQRLEKLESSDSEDTTFYAWHRSQSIANSIAPQFEAVSQCLATGKYLGNKCAKDDYVSTWDWSDYEVEPTNPWEREWSSDWLEAIAKTAWCIENGFSDYRSARDACVY
jgi:hypothetical protein